MRAGGVQIIRVHGQDFEVNRTLSVVVPIRDESEGLAGFLARLDELAIKIFEEFNVCSKLIAVDDCSSDSSAEIVSKFRASGFSTVDLVRLHRPSGAHIAISSGADLVENSAILVMAADGQDPIETAAEMVQAWLQGAEVVWAERESRADGLLNACSSRIFRWLLAPRDQSGARVPTGSFLLMDEERVLQFKGMSAFKIPTFEKVAWLNANARRIQYMRPSRTHGESKWGTRKRLSAGASAVLRSRTALIRLARYLSGIVLLAAFSLILVTLAWAIFVGTAPGWTSIAAAILAALAFQSIFFIIIIEYVSRTYAANFNLPVFALASHERYSEPGNE